MGSVDAGQPDIEMSNPFLIPGPPLS
jgi:hypothetical protein